MLQGRTVSLALPDRVGIFIRNREEEEEGELDCYTEQRHPPLR